MKIIGTAEEMSDTMSLDEFIIENKEASYLLKVKSDSMKEAGILSGDLVLVERGRTPREGDIVIAEVEGEYTMKYFKDIHPEDNLTIPAVVRAVIRKY